jgi:hypothetical protein
VAVAPPGAADVSFDVACPGVDDADAAGSGEASDSGVVAGGTGDSGSSSVAGAAVGDGTGAGVDLGVSEAGTAGDGVSASGEAVAPGVNLAGVDVKVVGTADGEPPPVAVGDGEEGVPSVGVTGPEVGVRVGMVWRCGSWPGVAHDAGASDPRMTSPAARSTSPALPARSRRSLFMLTPSYGPSYLANAAPRAVITFVCGSNRFPVG